MTGDASDPDLRRSDPDPTRSDPGSRRSGSGPEDEVATDREAPGSAAGSRRGRPNRKRRPLREEEPFATIRAHPRRFGIGIPVAFVVSIGAALPLVGRSLSLAIAVQLLIQTVALLWLYLPVARRRWESEREKRTSDGRPDSG